MWHVDNRCCVFNEDVSFNEAEALGNVFQVCNLSFKKCNIQKRGVDQTVLLSVALALNLQVYSNSEKLRYGDRYQPYLNVT